MRKVWVAWVLVWFGLPMVRSTFGGPRAGSNGLGPVVVLDGHHDTVVALAFLPDGKRAVSASRDKTLVLWDVASGDVLHTFVGHTAPLTCLAVNSDGTRIASGSEDKTVRIWDVSTGRQLAQLEAHTAPIQCVAFTRDGQLVSGAGDGVRLWDIAGQRPLWKMEARYRIDTVNVTPDGSRVAFTEDSGVTYVMDVAGRKRVARLGVSRFVPDRVFLSPDGNQVYYQNGQQVAFSRTDLASGQTVDMPEQWKKPEAMAFSSDSKLAFIAFGTDVDVLDTKSLEIRKGVFTNFGEFVQSVAVSPDGRIVLAGSGGQHGAGQWMPGRLNQIAVIAVPDLSRPPPIGPPAGKLSWEVIPARVRLLSGQVVALTSLWGGNVGFNNQGRFHRIGDSLDALILPGAVLLHRDKGILDEVMVDPNAAFSDACWDGRYIWISSRSKGVSLLDLAGKVLGTAGQAQGLPRIDGDVQIFPLGAGHLLVAGTTQPEANGPAGYGWCALVEVTAGNDTAQATLRVNVFVTERTLPGWHSDANARGASMQPLWIGGPFARSEGNPEVWIGCSGTAQSPQPIIRVDSRTLAAQLYNLHEPGATNPREQTMRTAPVALGDGSILGECGSHLMRIVPGPERLDWNSSRLIGDISSFPMQARAALIVGHRMYRPGLEWFGVDLANLECEDLGPGLRVEGQRVDDQIDYEVSAHFGLCALSVLDGCFYRFSTDPDHPAPVRATRDPAPEPAPFTESGVIRHVDGRIVVACGSGQAAADRRSGGRLEVLQTNDFRMVSRYTDIVARLNQFPEERKRIGITPVQITKLTSIANSWRPGNADDTRLNEFWDAYQKSTNPEARKKAAGPLLAEVRAIGERLSEHDRAICRGIQDVFTEKQWQLLQYQPSAPNAANQKQPEQH